MQLTTCCRCCSLKTGTIFSGVCGIVSSISYCYLFTIYEHVNQSTLYNRINIRCNKYQNIVQTFLFRTDTSRDFPNLDLHGKCRMENDNHRHPRQNDRKNHLRHQPLHDHFNLFAAHNRRCAGKKALLSVNTTIKCDYKTHPQLE